MGNTCFLNVCVQWLVGTAEIREALEASFEKARQVRGEQPNDAFYLEFLDLLNAMTSPSARGKTMCPARFVKFLQTKKALREGPEQADFTEFLFDVIHLLHVGVCRDLDLDAHGHAHAEEERRYYELWKFSEFSELLTGVAVSEIRDRHSRERLGSNAEIFSLLSLPVPAPPPQGLRIEDCFDVYASPELLAGDNAWFNAERGQRQEVLKRIRFRRFPAMLCVYLQRFSSCGTHKKEDEVRFGKEIDLAAYCCSPAAAAAAKYELYAVCNHFGGIHSGHYLLCMKSDRRWRVFDDERVWEVSERDVFSGQMSSSAYCLFYRRCAHL